MAYKITWHTPNRIILITLSGVLTLDQLHYLIEEGHQLVGQGIGPVHAIADMTNLNTIPKNLVEVVKIANSTPPTNAGFTVLVSGNTLANFFANTIMQALGKEMRHCNTIDDALTVITRIDETLRHSVKAAERG